MEFRYTKHQVPRGALADAEAGGTLYLFKKVSLLRFTYQIRLLAFRATLEGKKLTIRVPDACQLAPPLAGFVEEHRNTVTIERVK